MSDPAENKMNGHKPPDDFLERLIEEIALAEQSMTAEEFAAYKKETVYLLTQIDANSPQGLEPPAPAPAPVKEAETMADVFGPNLEHFKFTIPGLIR